MQTKALLVSDDLILRSEIKPVLYEAGVACHCCAFAGIERATSHEKFECILLDIADPVKFSEAIARVRADKVNRYAIVGALVAEEHRMLLTGISGVNFFVSKGARLVSDLKKAIASAQALMIHEKRRYYRHSVDLAVDVLSSGRAARMKMIDVSARGACLDCGAGLKSKTMRLGFVLPGMHQKLQIDGTVAWTSGTRVGVEFTDFLGDSEVALKAWLTAKEAEPVAVSSR